MNVADSAVGLAPLASNGGPTPTVALLAGSPAVDNGSANIAGVNVPETDQRGFPRTGGIDIGAFQIDPVPTSVYVNSGWSGDLAGTAVTWTDGSTHEFDYDAFATIQAGINAVPAGGTVNVAAGTYSGPISVNQGLTLVGAGRGVPSLKAPRRKSASRSLATE